MNYPKRSHIIALGISSILLGLIIYKPLGIIDDKMIYGENFLFVYEEGVASCNSSFSFKMNGIYIQESYCFGPNRKVGNYILKNDTLYFDATKISRYKYGVLNRKDSILEMYLNYQKTLKDFEGITIDSVKIQNKIEQSKKVSYKIYTLNELY